MRRILMQNRKKQQGGQTALLFTLGLTTMFGMVGLVSDVGYAYYRKQTAQAAAQAAAMASVKAAFASSSGSFQCGSSHVSCYASEYTCPSVISGYGNDNIEKGCLYA